MSTLKRLLGLLQLYRFASMLAYSGAARVGGVPWYDATDAMLFFDNKWLAQSSSLEARCGETFLLPGAYVDPTTYIGWGYPSVFPLPGGGFRAIFEVCCYICFHLAHVRSIRIHSYFWNARFYSLLPYSSAFFVLCRAGRIKLSMALEWYSPRKVKMALCFVRQKYPSQHPKIGLPTKRFGLPMPFLVLYGDFRSCTTTLRPVVHQTNV